MRAGRARVGRAGRRRAAPGRVSLVVCQTLNGFGICGRMLLYVPNALLAKRDAIVRRLELILSFTDCFRR